MACCGLGHRNLALWLVINRQQKRHPLLPIFDMYAVVGNLSQSLIIWLKKHSRVNTTHVVRLVIVIDLSECLLKLFDRLLTDRIIRHNLIAVGVSFQHV